MAANQFSDVGILNRDQYVDLLDKSMDIVWMQADRFKGVLSQFFQERSAASGTYKITSVSSTLPLVRKAEDTEQPYASPAPGYDKSITLYQYKLGIRATDSMRTMDRFGMVAGMMTGLVKSPMRKLEYLRASIFNSAFSGTDGADGLALCYDAHTEINPDAATWDNLSTGALTYGNLHTLRLLQRNMTNCRGFPDEVISQILLVPPALEQKAMECVTAKLMPENALNQPVTLVNSLKIVVSPFLSSATAHFLLGDLEGNEKGLYEVYHVRPRVDANHPQNCDIIWDKRVKMTVAVAFGTSKNVAGSAGS